MWLNIRKRMKYIDRIKVKKMLAKTEIGKLKNKTTNSVRKIVKIMEDIITINELSE